jgi:hypothetical protein
MGVVVPGRVVKFTFPVTGVAVLLVLAEKFTVTVIVVVNLAEVAAGVRTELGIKNLVSAGASTAGPLA